MEKMKLYLKEKKMTQKEFSKRHGIPESVLSRSIAGKTVPTLRIAILIEGATRGKVKAKDWVNV